MRTTALLLLGSGLPLARCFPTAENFAKLAQDGSVVSFRELHEALLEVKEKRVFIDPLTTPIDVSGEHAFRPPGKGDQRGPCPGLNALANHGYLSRDGVVGFAEAITAVNKVYGMGIDLITLLSVMGTVGVGNPLSLNPGFSIGGATPKSSNILGNLVGLMGTPRGLDGSHNLIEGDSSLTRDDLYVTGDAWTMNMKLFQQAYNSVQGDVITMDDLASRAAQRFEESIASNPFFYYGPYTGFVARNAGYIFAGRFLSNHSKEYPRGGHMTKAVFKSFWGVQDDGGKMVYKKGWERIPNNWYRIAVDYSLVDLNLDLVDWATKYPRLASIGGNMGRVNSFAGVDIGDASGGLLNAQSLLQGNNLLCFVLHFIKTFAPNSLSTLFKVLEVPLRLVNDAIRLPLLDLGCPAFGDLKMGGTDLLQGLLNKYPGAKKSGFAF